MPSAMRTRAARRMPCCAGLVAGSRDARRGGPADARGPRAGVVGHDPHFALGQRRVVLHAADERGAARGAGELALDRDDARPVLEDVLERLDGLAVGEAVDAAARFEARAQRRERGLRADDDDGGRHVIPV